MVEGLVVSVSGSSFTVETETGSINCSCRGKFRKSGIQPLAGDRVLLDKAQGGYVIASIEPRKNDLVRPPAANITSLLIVASAAPPQTPEQFIDSLTALAEYKGIRPMICINKTDLASGEELVRLYSPLYDVFPVSTVSGEGLDRLKAALGDGICLLTGNSGVGKSSLLNALDIGVEEDVGELSEKIGRGKQTTRRIRLHRLPSGGYLADSPGYSAFDVIEMGFSDYEELPNTFPEFRPHLCNCRWKDCGHGTDEGCAVTAAISRGEVAQSRHASYIKLREAMLEAEKNKYK